MKVVRLWTVFFTVSLCLAQFSLGHADEDRGKRGWHSERGEMGKKDHKQQEGKHRRKDRDRNWNRGRGNSSLKRSTPGYRIQPDFSEKKEVGEKARFSGKICYYKKHPIFSDKPSCHSLKNNQRQRVRFFYPDLSTEVTSKVNLTQTDKGLRYSFESEEIENDSPKNFYAFVQKKKSPFHKFFLPQEKIEKYLLIINKRLDKVRHPFVKRKLTKIKSILEKAKKKMGEELRKSENTLAQLKMPLQLGNQVVGGLEKSARFKDVKITLVSEHGQVIDGEKTKYLATVTKVGEEKNRRQKKGSHWAYDIAYSFQGEEIESKEDINLTAGEEVQFEFLSESIFKGAGSNFNVSVHRSRELPGAAAKWGFLQDFERGNLTLKSSVHKDSVRPQWSEVSLADEKHYLESLSSLRAKISDEFGRVKKKSLALAIEGELASGESFSQSFSEELEINSLGEELLLEEGATSYEVRADSLNLPEGSFQVTAKGSDFAGGEASFKREVTIDRTPPEILLGKKSGVLTNEASFSLPVSVEDVSPTQTQVFLNGEVVESSDQNEFTAEVKLKEGTNSLEVKAVDAAGYETLSTIEVELDSIPPKLALSRPEDGTLINARNSLEIIGESNEELKSLTLNEDSLNLSGQTFSTTLNVKNQQEANVNLKGVDLAGNVGTLSVTVPFNHAPSAKLSVKEEVIQEGDTLTLNASGSTDPENNISEFIFSPGDGEEISQSNPTLDYTYESAGTYAPKVKVRDELGLESEGESVSLKVNAPPVAKITLPEEEVKAKNEFTFSAKESVDSDGDILEYAWQMGDGTKLSGKTITHTYQDSGEVKIELTVTDSNGAEARKTKTIKVLDPYLPPKPDFDYSFERNKVTFDASPSLAESRNVETYEWSFGDSSGVSLTTPKASHKYDRSGVYSVTLKVTDKRGESREITKDIAISNDPQDQAPRVDFAYEVTNPFEVTFNTQRFGTFDLDGYILNYKIDYGDGVTKTHRAPSFKHTYDAPGVYVVTVTATDDAGNSASHSERISLTENGAPPKGVFTCNQVDKKKLSCSGSETFAPAGFIKKVKWEMGDGTVVEYSGEKVVTDSGEVTREVDYIFNEHVYDSTGTYPVTLTVTDSEERTHSTTKQIEVNEDNLAPMADFLCYQTGERTQTCSRWYSSDEDGFIQTTEWDMGDGTVIEDNGFVTHTYDEPGVKQVTLTVTDVGGKVDTKTIPVEVKSFDLNPPPFVDFYCSNTSDFSLSCSAYLSFDPNGSIEKYSWDFGDGELLNNGGVYPVHTYEQEGTYPVTLSLTDNEGKVASFTRHFSVGLTPEEIPVVVASCSRQSSNEVSCTGRDSYDVDGEIADFEWQTGDGTTYNSESFTHSYEDYGEYNIKLTLTDDSGNKADFIDHFVSGNEPPKAEFYAESHNFKVGETITFNGEASGDPNGELVANEWYVNDELTQTNSDLMSYTFNEEGFHRIRLVVEDDDGSTAEAEEEIYIQPNQPPVAFFSCQAESNSVSCKSYAYDPDGVITDLSWDMGDGTTLSGESITHSYDSLESREITLTATDDFGESKSETQNFELNTPPLAEFSCTTGTREIACESTSSDPDALDEIVQHNWNMGDGTTLKGESISHNYSSGGYYDISLEVVDSYGGLASTEGTFYVQKNALPSPHFSCEKIGDLLYECDAGYSSDDDGTIESYEWSFADGSTKQGEVITKQFADPGEEIVTLTVTDDRGGSRTLEETVTVEENQLPEITASCASENPLEVSCSAEAHDIDGHVTEYKWLIGGEEYLGDSVTANVELTTDSQVTLYVSDNYEGVATFETNVDIEPPEIKAAAECSQVSELEVRCYDYSRGTNTKVSSREWSFSDGEVLYGKEVFKSFEGKGSYEVTLTVKNAEGFSDTLTESFEVVDISELRLPSHGSLSLSNIDPSKFQPIDKDVQIDVNDTFIQESEDSTTEFLPQEIFLRVNGEQVEEENTHIKPEMIELSDVLEDGKNRIVVEARDVEDRILRKEFEIYAGSRTLDLSFLDESGSLLSTNEVEFSLSFEPHQREIFDFKSLNGQFQLSNVPAMDLLLNAQSGASPLKTTEVFISSETSGAVDIRFDQNVPLTEESNLDLSLGVEGWSILEGSSGAETVDGENLLALGGSSRGRVHLKRKMTVDTSSGAALSFSFDFEPNTLDDYYYIVLRNITTGKVVRNFARAKDLNLKETSDGLESLNIKDAIGVDEEIVENVVEVSLVAKSFGEVTAFERSSSILDVIFPTAWASSISSSLILLHPTNWNLMDLRDLELYDFVHPESENEISTPLQALTLGALSEHSRISLAYGKQNILPSDYDETANLVKLNFFDNQKAKRELKDISEKRGVDLFLRVSDREDQENYRDMPVLHDSLNLEGERGPFAVIDQNTVDYDFAHISVFLKDSFSGQIIAGPFRLRSAHPENERVFPVLQDYTSYITSGNLYSQTEDDAYLGGALYYRRSHHEYFEQLRNVSFMGESIKVNDIAKMNGGKYDGHEGETHAKGIGVDLRFIKGKCAKDPEDRTKDAEDCTKYGEFRRDNSNAVTTNKTANSIIETLNRRVSVDGEQKILADGVSIALATYDPGTAFEKNFEYSCLENGVKAIDYLSNDIEGRKKHKDHFHLSFIDRNIEGDHLWERGRWDDYSESVTSNDVYLQFLEKRIPLLSDEHSGERSYYVYSIEGDTSGHSLKEVYWKDEGDNSNDESDDRWRSGGKGEPVQIITTKKGEKRLKVMWHRKSDDSLQSNFDIRLLYENGGLCSTPEERVELSSPQLVSFIDLKSKDDQKLTASVDGSLSFAEGYEDLSNHGITSYEWNWSVKTESGALEERRSSSRSTNVEFNVAGGHSVYLNVESDYLSEEDVISKNFGFTGSMPTVSCKSECVEQDYQDDYTRIICTVEDDSIYELYAGAGGEYEGGSYTFNLDAEVKDRFTKVYTGDARNTTGSTGGTQPLTNIYFRVSDMLIGESTPKISVRNACSN